MIVGVRSLLERRGGTSCYIPTYPELECRDGDSEWSRPGRLLQGSEFVGVEVGRERLLKHHWYLSLSRFLRTMTNQALVTALQGYHTTHGRVVTTAFSPAFGPSATKQK